MSCSTQPEEVESLVLQHMSLARSLAWRFTGRGEPRDDLEQVAQLALVGAARRFDPERGVRFATFATVSVLGELKRHLRDRIWWVRAPRRLHDLFLEVGEAKEALRHQLGRSPTVADIAERLGRSTEEVLEAMEAGDGYRPTSLDASTGADNRPLIDELGEDDGAIDIHLNRLQLTRDLKILDDEARYVLKRYFFDEWTQAEIAEELGSSQMQVSRVVARTLGRLRSRAAEQQ